MKNLIILYNPYYQAEVIEQHLSILKKETITAFGKVKSKLRDYVHPHESILQEIYQTASNKTPIQLFLTDYSSVYVARIIAVTKELDTIQAPEYYNDLDVENWFVFDDLRLIVHKDFEITRDEILSNFIATNFNARTYALYGNEYVYPMQVKMKKEIDYFEKEDEDFFFYQNIFRSKEQLETKQKLIEYVFGSKLFYVLSPNSQDNLINAEIEYQNNLHNPLYDFSATVIKYSKAIEIELYSFMKQLFSELIAHEPSLKHYPYELQGRSYMLKDIFYNKPNFGTYLFLIKTPQIKDAINAHISNSSTRHFIFVIVPHFVRRIQTIRNEAAHGTENSLEECKSLREDVLGIGRNGFVVEMLHYKKLLKAPKYGF